MKGHLFAENAVKGIFCVCNRSQCRRIAKVTERMRRNPVRSFGLSGRNAVGQSLKPNDTLRILRQELKSGNGRQEVNPVEAGNGCVQSSEIADGWLRGAHTKGRSSPGRLALYL
jgi:hypothetical protein